jgi:hypothetical protein
MKLVDLEPRWLSPNVFIFKCPHCKTAVLSCKNIPMTNKEQRELLESHGLLMRDVTPTNDDFAWSFSGTDFATLTVTPSIDASKSGCWHGFITNGQIEGGL